MGESYHSAFGKFNVASSTHQTYSVLSCNRCYGVPTLIDSPGAQNKTPVQEVEHVYINLMLIIWLHLDNVLELRPNIFASNFVISAPNLEMISKCRPQHF